MVSRKFDIFEISFMRLASREKQTPNGRQQTEASFFGHLDSEQQASK